MIKRKQYRSYLTILAIIGLFCIIISNAQALVSDDDHGFETGGDPPEHSWTGSLKPNKDTEVFRGNEGITPLERQANPPGVYRDTACKDQGGPDPILSICRQTEMAQQIHAVVQNYVLAFMDMTKQFTAVMMHQVFGIGMFMDADMQIDTQREIQTLVARAHKDYHPSEQMCRIGTIMRSVADTEERITLNKQAISTAMMETYLGTSKSMTSGGYRLDMKARIKKFKDTYCNPADNDNGLELFCKDSSAEKERYNNDIDYQRIIESHLTLDVDFTNDTTADDEEIEEDIMMLARNLYWPKAMEVQTKEEIERKSEQYLEFRNLVAVNAVAHNSFAHIIAMKARAEKPDETESFSDEKGWYYMKNLMTELGIQEPSKLLGDYPSYYAQMEVLTKKIYQDPDFYTNLYDKPQNIRRISASLDAIKLMQGRDRFEASLRREMLLSMLLEQAIEKRAKTTNALLQED